MVLWESRLGIVDEIRGYIMPAWSTTAYTSGLEHCWGVGAGMITHPAARFAYLVKSTPSLQPQYLDKALEYETAIRETVDAFDVDVRIGPGADECYYLSGASGLVVAYNKQNALGRTFVDLWLSTGEAKYLDKATRLANFFRNDLTVVGDHYEWSYHPTGTGGEDISHAAINVDFAFQCYRAGIVFDETDMQRFVETLKYISLGAEDGFRPFVDGDTGANDYSYRTGVWSHLGYFDEEVREMVFDYFDYYDSGFGDERWVPFRNHGALAASYLLETSSDFAFNTPLLMIGDANGDGQVDADDASILAASWQTASGATWEMGDFNNDGAVNDIDASLLATNWQRGVLTTAAVPEPATLLLSFVAAAGLLLLRYRQMLLQFVPSEIISQNVSGARERIPNCFTIYHENGDV